MNKEISILSQTYKVLSNAAPPQGETAAREFYEGLKALEYAVWCLENSQEVAMGSPKQVIRIFPEFYIVERSEEVHTFLQEFGHWLSQEPRKCSII